MSRAFSCHPWVGRSVLYQTQPESLPPVQASVTRAAIITEVVKRDSGPDLVSLVVFHPSQHQFIQGVQPDNIRAEKPEPGTWRWPGGSP